MLLCLLDLSSAFPDDNLENIDVDLDMFDPALASDDEFWRLVQEVETDNADSALNSDAPSATQSLIETEENQIVQE